MEKIIEFDKSLPYANSKVTLLHTPFKDSKRAMDPDEFANAKSGTTTVKVPYVTASSDDLNNQ